MKVIHFIPDIDRTSGGTSTYMQLLAEVLGQKVELYIVTNETLNPLEIKNAKILFLQTGWRHYNFMRKGWNNILDEIKPDIVHINGCWLPECSWLQFLAQEKGYKVILTPHGMLEPWIMKRNYWTKKIIALCLYQRKAIVKANYLLATAQSEKQNLNALNLNHKIAVVPNGIRVEDIEPKRDWKRKKQLLFLSRVHPKKGIELLIEAVAHLKEKIAGYQIYITGEGDADYISQLKSLMEKKGVVSYFSFTGGVYGDAKWNLMRASDLFVLPSYSENFGIVVVEALACGTPVLTTTGTPWEELRTKHCGWYIKPEVPPLVEALEKYLEVSDSTLKEMGENGRHLAETEYDSAVMANKLLQLYSSLL